MKNKVENGRPNKRSGKGKGRSKTWNKDIPKNDGIINEDTRKFGNHPSWYKINEQMAKDTASIPFGYTLGERIDFGPYGASSTDPTSGPNNFSMPGVMRIMYTPTYGWNDNNTSPLNVCARNIYTYLKSVNSRAKTYDSNDLAIYICALDNALTFYSWMRRIYGILLTVGESNRFYPVATVHACGVDYHDMIQHVTQLRDYINVFATKLSAMPIPKNYSIFERHMWMNETIYLDSNNTRKSQSYIFVPSILYKYKLDEDGAGMLEAGTFIDPDYYMTFDEVVAYGNDMLERILYGVGEEDFNIIGGDILYAYGEGNVIRASVISETYGIVPTFDPAVLDQIHNARAFGRFTDFTEGSVVYDTSGEAIMTAMESLSLRQDANKQYLIHTPTNYDRLGNATEYPPANAMSRAQIVDLNTEDTGYDHVLVATRLLTIPDVYQVEWKQSPDATQIFYGNREEFTNCGSEIVNQFDIFYFATESGSLSDWKLHQHPALTSYPRINVVASTATTGNAVKGLVDNAAILAPFDQHPIIEYAVKVANSDWWYAHWNLADLNNYGVIDKPELFAMNRNVIMAMFGIAKFGDSTK